MGLVLLRDFHNRFGVFRIESRSGDGVSYTDIDSGDWTGEAVQAAVEPAGKRDYHGNWRGGWFGGGRSGVHGASAIHFEAFTASGTDHLHLPCGWMPRGIVPDSPEALLRSRNAWTASLPGSHRDYGSLGDRRKGRVAGEVIVASDGG